MPHPTPAHLAYGSATVISTTFVSLLLVQDAPGPVAVLIAVVALVLGAAVTLAAARHQAGRRPAAPAGEATTGERTATGPAPAPRRTHVRA
ncbi:hypothetical protein [Streptomyces sp. SBT349]|uniref:hypothetical protein n=1 Tax=Streptomyces sp. SBT349 TaxID=1580539 RepID=UPI00066CEC0C|nr:hypothetical protein [Streptomyces sp. SBT349]